LSVFFEYKLGFAGFTLYKELILILMGGIVAWGLYTRRIAYNCSWIDGAIVVYGLYLVGVSLFYPYALEHIIY
jgi:hypothetical protein